MGEAKLTQSNPATAPLRENLAHQMTIGDRVLDFSCKVLGGTITDERGFSRKDYVFFGLADKSIHTFEAIRLLCKQPLLDDAYALVRVLIEGIVNGTYVSQTNDTVANDYATFWTIETG